MYQNESAKMAAYGQAGNTLAYKGEDCCVERTSEVRRALDDLNSVIQRCDHVVGRLSYASTVSLFQHLPQVLE